MIIFSCQRRNFCIENWIYYREGAVLESFCILLAGIIRIGVSLQWILTFWWVGICKRYIWRWQRGQREWKFRNLTFWSSKPSMKNSMLSTITAIIIAIWKIMFPSGLKPILDLEKHLSDRNSAPTNPLLQSVLIITPLAQISISMRKIAQKKWLKVLWLNLPSMVERWTSLRCLRSGWWRAWRELLRKWLNDIYLNLFFLFLF